MVEVVWTPGWRQLVVPSLTHGIALAGVLLSSSWLPEVRWLALPIVWSAAIDVSAFRKTFGRAVRIRFDGAGAAIRDAEGWRDVSIDDPWLGPRLVVLRVRDGTRRRRWWIWRHEIGSSDDAALRRTLRLPSAGDGL